MTKYTIWYKKEIEAKNIKQAIDKDKKIKPVFHSIEENKEEIQQGASAIGFKYYPNDED